MSPLHRRDWQSERRVICYRTQQNLTKYSHHAHHFAFGHRFPRTIGLESCFKEPISRRKLVLEVIYQAIISEIMPSPPSALLVFRRPPMSSTRSTSQSNIYPHPLK